MPHSPDFRAAIERLPTTPGRCSAHDVERVPMAFLDSSVSARLPLEEWEKRQPGLHFGCPLCEVAPFHCVDTSINLHVGVLRDPADPWFAWIPEWMREPCARAAFGAGPGYLDQRLVGVVRGRLWICDANRVFLDTGIEVPVLEAVTGNGPPTELERVERRIGRPRETARLRRIPEAEFSAALEAAERFEEVPEPHPAADASWGRDCIQIGPSVIRSAHYRMVNALYPGATWRTVEPGPRVPAVATLDGRAVAVVMPLKRTATPAPAEPSS